MYKEILRSIAGIEVFPLISLGLFVAVFTLVVVYAVRLDAARATHMAGLPLEPHDQPSTASSRPSSTGDLQ